MSEGKLIVKNAKGVIFDLDGTLVDSMNVWKEIDVSYLGKHGYDVPGDLHDPGGQLRGVPRPGQEL